MGLFAKRPEQDQTAVSLPGEPLRQESPAERLADAAPIDVGALISGDGIASVTIPVPPAADDSSDAGGA